MLYNSWGGDGQHWIVRMNAGRLMDILQVVICVLEDLCVERLGRSKCCKYRGKYSSLSAEKLSGAITKT
jgi:hypothetical protein